MYRLHLSNPSPQIFTQIQKALITRDQPSDNRNLLPYVKNFEIENDILEKMNRL